MSPVNKSDLKVGDWVLVAFTPDKQMASSSRETLNYIGRLTGKVSAISREDGEGDFKASFLRPKMTRDHCGYVYGYPAVEDNSELFFKQVVGKLVTPEKYGRGLLKFQVHHKDVQV